MLLPLLQLPLHATLAGGWVQRAHPAPRSRPRALSLRRPGERYITRFQLADEFEEGLCTADPWLVLHKIDSPTKMRFVGQRVANCTAPEPWQLPKSIAGYFPEATRAEWGRQRAAWLTARGRSPDEDAAAEQEESDDAGGSGTSSSSEDSTER